MSTFLLITAAFYIGSFAIMLYCYFSAEQIPSDDEKF
ncbi:hypothetical protein EV200_101776 [Pedobacter psychrotolerans]|uniref:Uncharacterized protein n=1 Tax=Pedobacter psychrotolerans TaxID=1843235 RepID=A0A4V2S0E1_9SPHI|nr:hypothetical protein EV200_101776 [Pedobacter psychrotolerans]